MERRDSFFLYAEVVLLLMALSMLFLTNYMYANERIAEVYNIAPSNPSAYLIGSLIRTNIWPFHYTLSILLSAVVFLHMLYSFYFGNNLKNNLKNTLFLINLVLILSGSILFLKEIKLLSALHHILYPFFALLLFSILFKEQKILNSAAALLISIVISFLFAYSVAVLSVNFDEVFELAAQNLCIMEDCSYEKLLNSTKNLLHLF